MWDFLKEALLTSGIIFSVTLMWLGVQEFYRRYSKKHPENADACEKEITDCVLCSLKDICEKK